VFRFPLLIAIVVVTGSFASKVEAGCSLKRWDWQQHPMIIKLPCTKILEDTNRVPVKLINPPKKGQLSSKKLWVHYTEKTVSKMWKDIWMDKILHQLAIMTTCK
jgi:hypothetical protein